MNVINYRDLDDAEFEDIRNIENVENEDEDNLYDIDAEFTEEDENDAKLTDYVLYCCCGTDDMGIPRATSVITLQEFEDEGSEDKKVLNQEAMGSPVVDLMRKGEYMEIRYDFADGSKQELRRCIDTLKAYDRHTMSDEEDKLYTLDIVMFPDDAYGCYFVVFENPVLWAVSNEDLDGKSFSVKLMFEIENVHVIETDEINMKEMLASIQRTGVTVQEPEHEKILKDKKYEEDAAKEEERFLQKLKEKGLEP